MNTVLPKTFRIAAVALVILCLGTGLPSVAGAVDIIAVYRPVANCSPTDPAWSSARSPVPQQTTSLIQVYETYNAPYDPYRTAETTNAVPVNPSSAELAPRPLGVRAMNNGSALCIELTWADAVKNPTPNDVQRYADAVAVQIPFNGEDKAGADFLASCPESYHMGGDPELCGVHILYWRADLTKPQNITGVGMGTVQRTSDSDRLPNSVSSSWSGGKWRVIFKRPLAAASPNMPNLQRAHHYPLGFAQWDGALQERSGRKFATDDWADNLIIE